MSKPAPRVSCYGFRGVGFPVAAWLTGFLAYRWLIPMAADGWHVLVAAWWRLRPARVAWFICFGVDGAGYVVLRYWCWVIQCNRSRVFDWRRENVRCCVRADNVLA